MTNVESLESITSKNLGQYLGVLSNPSTPPEKLKQRLKLLWNFVEANEDTLQEMLTQDGLKILINLFKTTKSVDLKVRIGSIIMLLSFNSHNSNEDSLSNITIVSLTNLLSSSDFNVFLQSFHGMNELVLSNTPKSSSSPSTSSSSSFSSSSGILSHSLTPLAATLLLERITALLAPSSSLEENQKLLVLNMFFKLVSAGALNEAVMFSQWSDSVKKDIDSKTQSSRFLVVYGEFAKVIKELNNGEMTVLNFTAKEVDNLISNGKFFPTQKSFSLFSGASSSPSSSAPSSFTILANPSASGIEIVGKKFNFSSSSGRYSFFIDKAISSGVWKGEFEVDDSGGYTPYFGLASSSVISQLNSTYIGSAANSSMFHQSGLHGGGVALASGTIYASSAKFTLAMELNADANPKTLYVFVDGVQKPFCIRNVPSSVYMGFSGCGKTVVEVKSFERLSAPTVSASVTCQQAEWK